MLTMQTVDQLRNWISIHNICLQQIYFHETSDSLLDDNWLDLDNHAPFFFSLEYHQICFPQLRIVPSSYLTVLGAPKHDKVSIIFVAWLIGLSGFKHIKGSLIPFGTWLGLSCQATSISRLGALDCTVLFTIVNPQWFTSTPDSFVIKYSD